MKNTEHKLMLVSWYVGICVCFFLFFSVTKSSIHTGPAAKSNTGYVLSFIS